MAVELFRRAFALLDDTERLEEDRVDAVEELVAHELPQKGASERERMVLDMLMAHHHKRTPEEAARPQLAQKKSKPPKIPDPPRIVSPDAVAGLSLSKSATAHPVVNTVDEDRRASPPRTPYDELRDVFGAQNTNEDIDRALAHNDYDLTRTLEMLSGSGDPLATEHISKEQVAERIMCKYYMSSGNCLRGSACMYSHDGKRRICRFWLQGHCLAGDQCLFLHSVPAEVVQKFEVKPVARPTLPSLNALPALGAKPKPKSLPKAAPPPQQSSQKPTLVQFRRISDVLSVPNKGCVPLAAPRLLPWKSPEFGDNQKYVDLRLSAAKHAELRNKFLQQATTAWSHNNPLKARELSAEGQFHNDEMIDAYHTGADLLWNQRNKPSSEIYVDLHGLELGEAVDHLEARLHEIESTEKHSPRVVYVITGRGHFRAKRIADQLSQYVKAYLDKHGYKHRDFGVDTTFGRVFGVDPWSAIR